LPESWQHVDWDSIVNLLHGLLETAVISNLLCPAAVLDLLSMLLFFTAANNCATQTYGRTLQSGLFMASQAWIADICLTEINNSILWFFKK
jgi:hypothetical protein